MEPDQLIRAARRAADPSGNPTQEELKRAVSTAYYAMFHTLTNDCANLLVGDTPEARTRDEWTQAYRALDHAQARRLCNRDDVSGYHPGIQDFAEAFRVIQRRRHDADYSPDAEYTGAYVASLITRAENAISAYRAAPEDERRYFTVYLALRHRRE